ncbi:unnamed protein product [Adineta ricciae]|uniref:Uncharacterized protein n=2 Tax=Adineta ricciae TaxID=249248 RepID=A0A814ZJY3_ADIRI|nr:unnamed protein product [Adineta ricciae]
MNRFEDRRELSRLGEDDERSGFDDHTDIAYYNDRQEEEEEQQQKEPDPFEELEEFAPSVRIEANKFSMLCDHVENSLSEIDNSMFELLELKDTLLLQFLPPNVSTRITLVISRLYRAYSLSQIPLHELVRIVHLYSQPFDMKSVIMKKFYEGNEMKKRMLNAALQRLTLMEGNNKRYQQMRCISNWEKMYIQLALPRSNVRKWKFRLKTFRETSQLGYEHVIEWLNSSVPRPKSESDVLSKGESMGDEDELEDLDQLDSSGDQSSIREIDDQQQGSDLDDDIRSDNEGSFLSSAGKQRKKRTSGSAKVEPQEPEMKQIDVEIQATPDFDNQETSTGDVLSTKALIIRVYRPVGLEKKTFQCVIHTQGQTYKTNIFTFEKTNTLKVEDVHTPDRGNSRRKLQRSVEPRAKSRNENTPLQEENDINAIDRKQCDEQFIPMPTVLKRRSLLDTGVDPEAVNIDIFGDGKLCGSLVLSSEDLRMLDLPNLHSPSTAPLVTIDDSRPNEPEPTQRTTQLEFEELSYDLYKSWISRTPQTFTVYNDKREPIAKLPLHMFWYNKVEITHATKCTMTAPMKVRTPTAKAMVYSPSPLISNETSEQTIPLIVVPSTVDLEEEDIVPTIDATEETDEQLEMIKVSYEDKIARLHESYQAEIQRLRKLLSESPSHRSNRMDEVSEFEENIQDIIGEESSNVMSQHPTRPSSKRNINLEHHRTPNYGKHLSDSFLDRYQMFLERSATHRRQLATKIEQETAQTMERQMEIQHRLHKPDQHGERYDDLCLPAVFMPFRSGNVFNPRAYRCFHPTGTTDPRLTQTPTIFKLPPLPSGSVSVLNLFELSRCYDGSADKEQPVDQTMNQTMNQTSEPARPFSSPTNQQQTN